MGLKLRRKTKTEPERPKPVFDVLLSRPMPGFRYRADVRRLRTGEKTVIKAWRYDDLVQQINAHTGWPDAVIHSEWFGESWMD